MFEFLDSAYHQARVEQEIDAACRCTNWTNTERHLKLAFLHQERQRPADHVTLIVPKLSAVDRRTAISRTDKES